MATNLPFYVVTRPSVVYPAYFSRLVKKEGFLPKPVPHLSYHICTGQPFFESVT